MCKMVKIQMCNVQFSLEVLPLFYRENHRVIGNATLPQTFMPFIFSRAHLSIEQRSNAAKFGRVLHCFEHKHSW